MKQRQLYRTQFPASIGTSESVLAPANQRRIGLILSPPPPVLNEEIYKDFFRSAFNSGALGTVQSYTVPAGTQAFLTAASYHLNAGAAPVVQLQIVHNAVTFVVANLTSDAPWTGTIPLQAGDIVQQVVTTVGAGSTIDAMLGIEEDAAGRRVTVSFIAPAVLDSGINLYPGGNPLVIISDHIGQAFREEIHAIASVAGQAVTVVEISEVDCPCLED